MSCQRCGRHAANTPFCAPCEVILDAQRDARASGVVRLPRMDARFRPKLPVSDDDFRGAA